MLHERVGSAKVNGREETRKPSKTTTRGDKMGCGDGWSVLLYLIDVLGVASISAKLVFGGVSRVCREVAEECRRLSASCVGFVVSVQRRTTSLCCSSRRLSPVSCY